MKNSYFAIPSPLAALERWLNPHSHTARVVLREVPVAVSWTRRAERQLQQLERPLLAEMQLYFSCVVKKRVLFHQQQISEELEPVTVNDRLQVAFRAVQATSCDPVEFAASFPVQQEFHTLQANRMSPSALRIDYRHGIWEGEFSV